MVKSSKNFQLPKISQISQSSIIGRWLLPSAVWGLSGMLSFVFFKLLFVDVVFPSLKDNSFSGQVLDKLLFAIILLIVFLVLSGVIAGWLGGMFMRNLKEFRSKGWLPIRLSVSFGSANGLVILPFIFLLAIIAYYIEAPNIWSFVVFFGLFGIFYGLISGLVFSLLTIRTYPFLKTLFFSMVGFMFGGGIIGVFLWIINDRQNNGDVSHIGIILGLSIFLFYFFGGLGVTFSTYKIDENVFKKRYWLPRGVKVFLLIVILLSCGVFIYGNLEKISSFLLIRDANTKSQLTIQTTGVRWDILSEEDIKNSGIEEGSLRPNTSQEKVFTCSNGVVKPSKELKIDGTDNLPSCKSDPLVVYKDGLIDSMFIISGSRESTNVPEGLDALYIVTLENENKWTKPVLIDFGVLSEMSYFFDDEDIYVSWSNGKNKKYVHKGTVRCNIDSFNKYEKAVYDAIINGNFYTNPDKLYYCGNKSAEVVHLPNPIVKGEEKYSENGAFDVVANLAKTAKYEVLFTTMEWVGDAGDDKSPGYVYTKAIGELYKNIKEHPENYPRGLHVKILLGNYPEIDTLEWGNQIFHVLEGLHAAGVYELENDDIGWKVEVANFAGSYPHSHTKFQVIDGEMVMSGGFNYSYLHYDTDHPSGKGLGMADLGLVTVGPIAQISMAVFDDLWDGANGIQCSSYGKDLPVYWKETCSYYKTSVSHVPEVKTYKLMPQDEVAFSLYRTNKFKEADVAIPAVINKADSTIDVFEVNFSLELMCDAGIVLNGICSFDQSLDYMKALVDAAERGAKIRVMVEKSNANGLENRIGIKAMYDELKRRGVEDNVEFRFFEGKMHSKGFLIDNQFLVIGSQNFHYSSWGPGGLAEYSTSTSNPATIEDFKLTFDTYWNEAIPASELMSFD